MRRCVYLAVFAVLFVYLGCASRTKGGSDPQQSPLEQAYAEVLDARALALDEAIEESESMRSYNVLVRFNPGRCGAPNQEIFVRGRWERVAITGRNDRAQLGLQEWTDAARREPLLRTRMSGRWDDRVWSSPGGVQWPVFEVSEVQAGLVALAPDHRAHRSSLESGTSDGEWLAARCAGAGSRSTP